MSVTETGFHVAIVGCGPSGFYAAEALLTARPDCTITMIDRLPTPFGLVRSGVAPDHPKLKQPIAIYDRTAQSPRVTFIGNVEVGRDVSVETLQRTHHAVIFAYGAALDRRLSVPGSDLMGVHSSTAFVGWYNGHPDHRDHAFDLSCETAVVVGHGNVALDVARILSRTADELKQTDIAQHALDALAHSRIREVVVIGRRGPAQAKFAPNELMEFGNLAHCQTVVDEADLILNEASAMEAQDKMNRAVSRNLELLRSFAQSAGAPKERRCHIRFFLDPLRVVGRDRVEGVECIRTSLSGDAFAQTVADTGEREHIRCGMVISCIGFRGSSLEGLSFDAANGTVHHRNGRLLDDRGQPRVGLYATGWIKRGASGTIGSNRADSVETIKTLLSDAAELTGGEKMGASALKQFLSDKGVHFISYEQWQRIDNAELHAGELLAKPREKFTRISEMLALARSSGAGIP